METTGDLGNPTCPICGQELVPDAVFCPYCGRKLEGTEECEDYSYEAFISYRHVPNDRKVALKVQRSIESFTVPKSLQAVAGKKKLGKCFRDEDELPTSSSLSNQIEDALRHSRFLIVVCSPQARESMWVQQEVMLFASYHGREKILAALASGEPDESFPELLLTRLEPSSSGVVKRTGVEPIAADLRSSSKGKDKRECLRLVASLIGCGYDDLRQRLRMRRARAITALASCIAAVSIAFGAFAVHQQMQIEENYRQMQVGESEFLANEAEELLDQGDRYQAIQVALAALPESSTSDDRPFVPAAQLALERALQVWPSPKRWIACYSKDHLESHTASFSKTGLLAFIRTDRMVEVSEVASGDIVCVIDALQMMDVAPVDRSYVGEKLGFAGDKLIYRSDSGFVGCFDARSGSLEWKADCGQVYSGDDIVVSSDGSMLAVAEQAGYSDETIRIHVLDISDGHERRTLELPASFQHDVADSQYSCAMAFSPDGTRLAVGKWGRLFEADLATGTSKQAKLQFGNVKSVAYSQDPDRLFVVSTDAQLGTLTGGTSATLEVFGASLEKLWDRTDKFEYLFSEHGYMYESTMKPCGWWSYYGKDDLQLVVISGCNLLLLDDETGKELLRITADTPYLDCMVSNSAGSGRINMATAGGVLSYRVPADGSDLFTGSLLDVDTAESTYGNFLECDGQIYVLMGPLDSSKQVMYRHAGLKEVEGATLFESSLNDASFTWGFDYIGGVTDTAAVLWDGNSFEEVARWDFDDLDKLAPVKSRAYLYVVYDGEAGKLVICGEGRAKDDAEGKAVNAGTAFYVFDAKSRSLVAEYSLEDIPWSSYSELTSYADDSGQTLLMMRGSKNVAVFDAEQPGDRLAQVQRDYPTSIVWAHLAGSSVILFEKTVAFSDDGSHVEEYAYQMELVDAESGAPVESDLAGFIPKSASAERYIAFSPDDTRMVMACDDGMTRLFDAQTGALLWETSDVPPVIQSLSLVFDEDVLLQGGDGRLVQLSGEDGSVKRTSTTALEDITGYMRIDDHTIVASYWMVGMSQHSGLAIIPTDAESLDPVSDVYFGECLAHDGSSILAYNATAEEMYRYPWRSLDSLIEMAHEKVQGHELTDTERHLYHID